MLTSAMKNIDVAVKEHLTYYIENDFKATYDSSSQKIKTIKNSHVFVIHIF